MALEGLSLCFAYQRPLIQYLFSRVSYAMKVQHLVNRRFSSTSRCHILLLSQLGSLFHCTRHSGRSEQATGRPDGDLDVPPPSLHVFIYLFIGHVTPCWVKDGRLMGREETCAETNGEGVRGRGESGRVETERGRGRVSGRRE